MLPTPTPISSPRLQRAEVDAIVEAALANLGRRIASERERRHLARNAAARMCDVSPRNFTLMEEGANVTLGFLMRVALGLDLEHFQLGPVRLDLLLGAATVEFVEKIEPTARYLLELRDFLLGRGVAGDADGEPKQHIDGMPADARELAPVLVFSLDRSGGTAKTREGAMPPGMSALEKQRYDPLEQQKRVRISGEVMLGEPIRPVSEVYLMVPEYVVEHGEEMLRVRDESLREWGLHQDDLLVVERRQTVSNGETVLALHNGGLIIGRYWATHGEARIILHGDAANYVTAGEGETLEIYGVLTLICKRPAK